MGIPGYPEHLDRQRFVPTENANRPIGIKQEGEKAYKRMGDNKKPQVSNHSGQPRETYYRTPQLFLL